MLEIAARGAQLLIALAGAYVVALWFVLVVWTFRDVESRSRSVVTQVAATLLSVLFFVPGLLLYLILRPKDTLDGTFQRSLEEEYLLQDLEELPLCQRCRRYVEDDFVLCPHCHAQLRESCTSCARLVDLRWALCPYCGTAQHQKPATVERVEAPAARWAAPSVRRRRTTIRAVPADGTAAVSPAAAAIAADARATIPRPMEPLSVATPPSGSSSPAPLTLLPGVRQMLRPTDRFRARLAEEERDGRDGPTDGVGPPLIAASIDQVDGETPAANARPTWASAWSRTRANGSGRAAVPGVGPDGSEPALNGDTPDAAGAASPRHPRDAPAEPASLVGATTRGDGN